MTELPARRLTCREVVSVLTDYLEDVLDATERARIHAHLQACPDCLAYVEQLRMTIGALARLREEDVPEPILTRLADAFRRRRGLA